MTGTVIPLSESYLWSSEFQEGMKKVGPGSRFWYRCRFDPLTEDEFKLICEYEERSEQES